MEINAPKEKSVKCLRNNVESQSLQRRESVKHTFFLSNVEAVRRFNACGWLGYCLSLTTYDEDAAIEFTRTFD